MTSTIHGAASIRLDAIEQVIDRLLNVLNTSPDASLNEIMSALFTVTARAVPVLRDMGADMRPIEALLMQMLDECGPVGRVAEPVRTWDA